MGKTVLVLGAGASEEVGLPIGEKLKDRIADSLTIKFDVGQFSGKDMAIANALQLHAVTSGHRDVSSYLVAARRIVTAMPQAPSIDNYLDSQDGHKLIELFGKLAIVRCILKAEHDSLLHVDPREAWAVDFQRLRATWFNRFWSLLTVNCKLSEVEKRFQSLAIISFNYDRCIEHYLFHALRNYYHIDDEEAAELMRGIEIYHPYGAVGSLPWQRAPHPVTYGSEVGADGLLTVLKQIKTFTEGTDPASSDIVNIRARIADADRLIFLGFAFHPQNLQLLWEKRTDPRPGRSCIGTAYNIYESDMVRDELSSLSGITPEKIVLRRELKCCGLFDEHPRALSALSR